MDDVGFLVGKLNSQKLFRSLYLLQTMRVVTEINWSSYIEIVSAMVENSR